MAKGEGLLGEQVGEVMQAFIYRMDEQGPTG